MNTRLSNGVLVVQIGNRLEPQLFPKELQAHVLNGHPLLALDMQELTFVESSGLGTLVSAYKQVVQAGGRLVVFNLQPYVQKLVDITKLHRILAIQATEAEAVAYLQSNEAPPVTLVLG